MRTGSFGRLRSTTSSAVMIFVRLAIAATSIGRRRQSTSPVSRSKTSPARGGLRSCTWNASTPPSGTSGTGSASTSAASDARGSVGAAATGGDPAASGRLGDAPWPPSSKDHTAAAPTPTGAARIARTAISRGIPDLRRAPSVSGRTGTGGCVRPVVVLVDVVREQLDREQPEHEATDVGKVRDAAARAGRLAERGQQLQQEPHPEYEQRGQSDHGEDDDDEHDGHHAGARIQPRVRAEHPGYGAAGAHR